MPTGGLEGARGEHPRTSIVLALWCPLPGDRSTRWYSTKWLD